MLPVAILAGGLATRLRPLTEKIPKSLVDIAGRPFIDHQLSLLRSRGLEKVVLCTGFLGEQIEAYVDDGTRWGLCVQYSSDGPDLLGTGGAIKKALPLLGEDFFVLYGDSYLPTDYAAVERAYLTSGAPALMTVFKNEGQWDSSNVVFVPDKDGECTGRVKFYSKKDRIDSMQFIDYGLGCFSSKIFEGEKEKAFDLADLYADAAVAGELAALEVQERFYEIGSFMGIKSLEKVLNIKH